VSGWLQLRGMYIYVFMIYAMVTNHLRAPYGVYFIKYRTILRRLYGAPPAAGRIVRFLNIFWDIVRCPVKLRYYLKFHGARTAFGWVIEGKMTSTGHRTVPGRRPTGVCTHWTGTGRFLFKNFIVRFQRCPTGRTSYDVWQAPRTLKNLLINRPMPVRAPADVFYESNCHRWEATWFCRRTYCIYIYIYSLLETKT